MPQSLGERVADLLIAEGVQRFFSLPEVTFAKVHDALDRAGVKLIAPHHEAVAGYMAEAWAQLTGTIGVVGGSVGPVYRRRAGAPRTHDARDPEGAAAGRGLGARRRRDRHPADAPAAPPDQRAPDGDETGHARHRTAVRERRCAGGGRWCR